MQEALDKASKDHPKLTLLLQHVASVKKEKPNDKVDDKLVTCGSDYVQRRAETHIHRISLLELPKVTQSIYAYCRL